MDIQRYPDFAKISETQGYKSLPPKQKQMIRLSLMLQKRVFETPSENLSQHTYKIYCSLNCHLSVYMLETGKYTGHLYNDNIPRNFFRAKYSKKPISEQSDLLRFLPEFKLPTIIHISLSPKKVYSHEVVLHTMLVLDITSDKDLIIWEKEGTLLPFRIANVSDQLKTYPNLHWGYRPLMINTGIRSFFRSLIQPYKQIN